MPEEITPPGNDALMFQSSRFVLGEIATAILFVAVAPRAATAGDDTLAVTEGAQGTTLALNGMMPFHATANNVFCVFLS